jgi:hypothetical protein
MAVTSRAWPGPWRPAGCSRQGLTIVMNNFAFSFSLGACVLRKTYQKLFLRVFAVHSTQKLLHFSDHFISIN